MIRPLYLDERYAGKNIGGKIAATSVGFVSVYASPVRPYPFALMNCSIPNAGKPRAIGKHLIPAHLSHSCPVHKLTPPQ